MRQAQHIEQRRKRNNLIMNEYNNKIIIKNKNKNNNVATESVSTFGMKEDLQKYSNTHARTYSAREREREKFLKF